ncbi:hypothetical protein HU144_00805 [Brevibacterium sp. UCMA 11752]|nr:hypothetical protein [Brevibacterium sp. UCMA 11752]
MTLKLPHGHNGINLDGLNSEFQARMVKNDLDGAGLQRIVQHSTNIDLVLIDLVDERRGFWLFPDGTTMTNSIEAESCGATRDARQNGARKIEFGTQEHFDAWKLGYKTLLDGLALVGLADKTVLLEIDWAAAIQGSRHPSKKVRHLSLLSRRLRRLHRGKRDVVRAITQGSSPGQVWTRLRNVPPTDAESYADSAIAANKVYSRYFEYARKLTVRTVRRESKQLRIDPLHKWGPEPYHYRTADYRSIADEINRIYE